MPSREMGHVQLRRIAPYSTSLPIQAQAETGGMGGSWVVSILCPACASGRGTPIPRTTDQKVQVAIECLEDERLDVRRAASEAPCGLEAEAAGGIPALLEALKDAESASVRSEIVSVLG